MLTDSGKAFAVLAVLCLIGGWALGSPVLIVFGLAFGVALLIAAAWMSARPRIEATRSISPARVEEGEAARGVITVTNIGRRRSPPFLAVEMFAGEPISVPLPSLAAGDEHTAAYLLPAEKRGHYPVGPLTIGHVDPLRLMRSGHAHGVQATLVVHPRIHDVGPVPSGRNRELDGRTRTAAPQGGVAFHSLREYVPGDDLRLIHWKASARQGELMVRHNVVTHEPRLMIVLDTDSDSYTPESFEDAVRAAASLVVAGVSHHFPVEFRTTGGLAAGAEPGGYGLTSILDLLAGVEPDENEGLAGLISVVPGEQGISLGVVTGQPTTEKLAGVSVVRPQFDMVTIVQLGEEWDRPPAAVSGAMVINAATSDEFEHQWNERIPR